MIASCEKKDGASGNVDSVPPVISPVDEPVGEQVEEKILWFSTTADKIYSHIGGRVHFKCVSTKCEVELEVSQFYINSLNIRSYSFAGEIDYSVIKNAYVGGLRDTSGNEGYGIVIKNGLPILISIQDECLLFGDSSEDPSEYAAMTSGKTNYSSNEYFLPYIYGIDLEDTRCDY